MASIRQRVQPNRDLIEHRINRGLSRRELGARIGVSAEAIRLAELGFTPSVRVQFALASEYGERPMDLWPIERQRVVA